MRFELRAPQIPMNEFILEHERCNIFAGMGLGKTTASVNAFDTLRMLGESERAIVFAPKRVAETSWPDDIQKFKESFGHLRIAAAIGTEDERIAALKQKADITTINYDNIEWLINLLGDHWPWDTVFADESIRLKGLRIALQRHHVSGKEFISGQGATRAKLLARVSHTKVRRWINLNGSPAPNGLQDLWGQQFFVDSGKRLGTSFGAFKQRWFRTVQLDGFTKDEPLAHAHKEITGLMRDCSLTIEAKDFFDIAQPVERTVFVDLPPKARAMYDQMEEEYYAQVEQNLVEALNGGAKCNKCRQIASGSVFVTEDEWKHVHDAKIDALKSIINEAAGASVLVAYQFKPELERILKAFPKARLLKGKREIDAFQRGLLPIGVCHPASAGPGLSLQDNCWILVDYSTGWNLYDDEQIIERIGPTRQMQSGFKRAVFRYRIVAKRTIEEEVVLPRITSKTSVQESVKTAMKRRKGAVAN